MSTTSNFSSNSESFRNCSARVEYKDRQGACQREARYPDPDGIRWWCGLHNPDRKQRPAKVEQEVIEQSGIADQPVAQPRPDLTSDSDLSAALHSACIALSEISQMRDSGWPANTPVEKYKIMMSHMADRAAEAFRAATIALHKSSK